MDSSNLFAPETEQNRVEQETTNLREDSSTNPTHNSYDVEEKTTNAKEDSTTKSINDLDKDSSRLSITETEIVTITDNRTDSSNLSAPETEHHLVEQETTYTQQDSSTDSTLNSCDVEEKTTNSHEDSTTKSICNLDKVQPETTYKEKESSHVNITESEIVTVTDNRSASSNLSAPETETLHSEVLFGKEINEPDFEGFCRKEIEKSDRLARRQMLISALNADVDEPVYFFEYPHESEDKIKKYDEIIARSKKFIEQAESRIKAQLNPGVYKKRRLSQTNNNNGNNCNNKQAECKRLRLSGDENHDETNIRDVSPRNGSVRLVNKNEKSSRSAHPTKLDKVVASANDRLTLDPDKKAGNNGFKKPEPVPVKPRKARRPVVKSVNSQRYSTEDLFKPRRSLSSTSSRRRDSGSS